MELKNALIYVPQREVSGSRTAARLDYQKNWALKKMLKKHTDNLNYVFVFEFHDDGLFLILQPTPEKLISTRLKHYAARKYA